MASGCDIFKCLDGKSCVGQGPWLIPDEPTPSPTPTESSPVPSSPIPDITSPTAAPGTVGWILTLHSEEPTNYWINDWSEKDIFLNSNGRKTVRTRCVTIEETSYAALLPDGTKIEPDGNFLGFDSTPDDGPNACCFAWFADDKCSEISGKSGKICGDGSAEFDFPVMSWKVDGCNGWWTGPPQ
jgi:hypothetical protein